MVIYDEGGGQPLFSEYIHIITYNYVKRLLDVEFKMAIFYLSSLTIVFNWLCNKGDNVIEFISIKD